MSDEIRKLELKITELENTLKAYGIAGQAKIDPKDMEIFKKVSGQLGLDPDAVCGINECKPCIAICRTCRVCSVCRVCRVCIYECSCGPCNVGGGFSEGFDRFGGLG